MVYVFSDFELDAPRRELRHGGRIIEEMEPKVFDVLLYLIRQRDHVVSKDELHRACWGQDYVTDSALVRCISEIRKRLGDNRRHQHMIKTVPRKGYLFSAPVQEYEGGLATSTVNETYEAKEAANPEALLDHFASMLVQTRLPSLIDAPAYLRMLKREIHQIQCADADEQIAIWLKEQIKAFCISSEIYFTYQISESIDRGQFFYSCSSLLDHGYTSYLGDTGWLTLLHAMGQAQRRHSGHFLRIFFVDFHPLTPIEFEALWRVVKLHLQHGVHVALMDHSSIPSEAMAKRNIAWLQGRLLIHATDQSQWDLAIASHKSTVALAREKYDFFVNNAVQVFDLIDQDRVVSILSTLFSSK